MAKRREHRWWTSGLGVALLAAGPLGAQTAPVTANTATPAPAPADSTAVGPPQLRDFTLNGTVTRRADPAPVRDPRPAPVAAVPSTRANPPANRPAPARTTPVAAAPDRASPTVAAPDRDRSPERVTLDLPPPSPAGQATATEIPSEPLALPPVAPAAESAARWPWLLALLAALLGAAFLFWRKRGEAGARSYAGVTDLIGEEPAPSPQPPSPAPALARTPAPPVTPPPRETPRTAPAFPAPRAPQPAHPKPARVALDGGIVASNLRPRLGFELRPVRVETDDKRGAALLVEVIVTNNGHAPARDVLVEARLINAGPKQDELIGQFFREPVGKGERFPLIPPMGRVSLKLRLAIAGEQMEPIEIDGRQLFVPLVAFNSLYRWSGGEDQDSASFLVGRGDGEVGKMAPFRLDQGARSWTGLGARQHSSGFQR